MSAPQPLHAAVARTRAAAQCYGSAVHTLCLRQASPVGVKVVILGQTLGRQVGG